MDKKNEPQTMCRANNDPDDSSRILTSTPEDPSKELTIPSPAIPGRKKTRRKKDQKRTSLKRDEVWESPLLSQQVGDAPTAAKGQKKSLGAQPQDIGLPGTITIRASPANEESAMISPDKTDKHWKSTSAAPVENNPKRLTRAPVPPGEDDETEPSHDDHNGGRLASSLVDAPAPGLPKSAPPKSSSTSTIPPQKRQTSTKAVAFAVDATVSDPHPSPTKDRCADSESSQAMSLPSLADGGDATVPAAPRASGDGTRKRPPPRNVERDPPLIDGEQDLERGLAEDGYTELNASLTQRRSSAACFGSNARLLRDDQDANKRRCVRLAFLAIFLFLGAAAAIIVVILLQTWQSSSEQDNVNFPSAAPTTFYSGVLPLYTQQALDNPSSPQVKALCWLERDEGRNSLSALSALQRFVLATLFYATGGERWDQAGEWLNYSQSECSWYAHEFHSVCDSTGRFHTLSLPGNSIRGTLPEELELLSTLSIIQLQDNGLSGTLPERMWSSWGALVFLNVYNNSLEGSIPSEVAYLANAKHLNTLSLRSNRFSGSLPSELGLLHVEFLSLSGNAFSGNLPSELGTLTNVRDLYLHDNQFFGTIPSTLGLLSKLTRLELHNNDIMGSVPQEVCDLITRGSLVTVTVDCGQVECTCGCDCSASRFNGGAVFDNNNGSL
jgi:hypothetical protein